MTTVARLLVRPRRSTVLLIVAVASLLSSAWAGWFIPRHLPRAQDEFAYLVQAQTFAAGRLTNPTPPLWEFFETPHTLLRPTYTGKYQPGPALVLALGLRLGAPILGVWLASAAFAVSVAWMTAGFLPARWALLAGLLTIGQFGWAHGWAQTYWGGALAAAGGALVVGGTRRLWRRTRPADALLLGLGLVLLALTRPFEGLLVALIPAGLVLERWRRAGWTNAALARGSFLPLALVVAAGLAFMACYNERVTGSALHLPYAEYERQYSGAPLFAGQHAAPAPVFHNQAMRAFYEQYVASSNHITPAARLAALPSHLRDLVREYLGWLLAALAAAGLLLSFRGPGTALAAGIVLLTATSIYVSNWFGLHYHSPAAGLYVFLAVVGARALWLRWPALHRHFLPVLIVMLLAQAAIVWTDPVRRFERAVLRTSTPRQNIIDVLTRVGGRHLVLIEQPASFNAFGHWVFNDAAIDASTVVWAWDRGPAENRRLLAYYPERRAVLMRLRDGQPTFEAYPPPPDVHPAP
jgi:hypothetical protein